MPRETRTIVRGWKGSLDSAFVEVTQGDASDYYAKRIVSDAELPDWQPHVTSFTVEHREVTEWGANDA